LTEKTALVIGSAAGLGAAIAIARAEAGANVITHGNRRSAEMTSAAITAIGHDEHSHFIQDQHLFIKNLLPLTNSF
jgi:2-deoxy-D-gluconate 3-dehydrogenase